MHTATSLLESAVVETPHSAELALLHRIVASRHFAKSGLLSRFLRHICESHLAGRANELTEQQIGVHVFGRSAGYDCGIDNIVRNYARQLRSRLDDYFRWEGREESLRLEVPRGGYKPVFFGFAPEAAIRAQAAPALLVPVAGAPATVQATEQTTAHGKHTARWMIVALCCITTVSLMAAVGMLLTRPRIYMSAASPLHTLWATVFRPDRDTVIVTADSGFGTLQDMLGRRLSLADYTSLRLGTLEAGGTDHYVPKDMASQRYTSMTDLEAAVALSHLPEVVPNRFSIRFARDLRMEDLKDNNVVLLGSAYTNPWSELFDKTLNFQLQGDTATHTWRFLNRHPAPGEPTLYQGERDGASHLTYARVAWVRNIDRNGHVLMLQGLDMAGTQAAAQSLLHGNALSGVWQQTMACHTADASFEVLLGTTSIGSNAGTIRVLAKRVTC